MARSAPTRSLWRARAAACGVVLAAAVASVRFIRADDRPLSFEALQARAERGDSKALLAMGSVYAEGRAVPQDYARARGYLQRAAAAGSAVADYNLGLMAEAGQGGPLDLAAAFGHYARAAREGLAQAQFNLGNMYANGRGVAADPFASVLWLRLAALQGLAEAQYNLALAYETGRGIPANGEEAQKWYRAASDRAYAPARYNLALMLGDGRGSAPNPAAAAALLRAAAQQGFAAAQNDYGVALAQGRGVERDPVEAYAWLSLAVENGLAPHNRDVVGRKLTDEQRAIANDRLGRLRAGAGPGELVATVTVPAVETADRGAAVAAEEPAAVPRADPDGTRASNAGVLDYFPEETWTDSRLGAPGAPATANLKTDAVDILLEAKAAELAMAQWQIAHLRAVLAKGPPADRIRPGAAPAPEPKPAAGDDAARAAVAELAAARVTLEGPGGRRHAASRAGVRG